MRKVSPTLYIYLGKQFLFGFGMVFIIITLILLLSSSIEMLRHNYGKNISALLLIRLALMKLPILLEKILPFCILLGGILSFNKMNKSQELIAIRTSGISVWQFLAPGIVCSLLIGIIATTIFNPFATYTFSRQEKMAAKHLKTSTNKLTIANGSIWLREHDDKANRIIRIQYLEHKKMLLHNVTFLIFNQQQKFLYRLDAEQVKLESGEWLLTNTTKLSTGKLAQISSSVKLPTNLNINQLYDSFSAPEAISFWDLPGFINMLRIAGFSGMKHSLYFYRLIIDPLFFVAMNIIAAAFSLIPPRYNKLSLSLGSGVTIGFVIYFINDIVYILGLSGEIPLLLAALSPVLISFFAGITLILHLEDG